MLSKQLLGGLLVLFPFTTATAAASLDIHLPTGTFRGTPVEGSGVEKWLGIPFAQPPVGDLRFKAPVPITQRSSAIKNATSFGNACPQQPSELGAPMGEDCLYLNVWRPAGLVDQNLPVVFWVHGGAYTNGYVIVDWFPGHQPVRAATLRSADTNISAASMPLYEATQLVETSVSIGKPIIVVSTNYRLNTFGFLASAHQPPQDLNAGLLDQRLALNFVQDNIAAFGGDPNKVTIWGQSAGAGSALAHFLYPTERRLFRAGIGESSTGPFKSSPPASTYDRPGLPFNRLLSHTGCTGDSNPVDCLRAVPFETLLNISNAMINSTLNRQLWQPCIGPAGSMMTEEASSKIIRGDFLHLPWLGGTNVNEGNGFSVSLRNMGLSGQAQADEFNDFIRDLVIDNSTLTQDVFDRFDALFPANDPALGAPFNTGDSLYDRGAAWYTVQMFLSPRRLFFEHGSSHQRMFAYYFREFIPGSDPTLGVAHETELPLIFGSSPALFPVIEDEFAHQMKVTWINFISDSNPGGGWPSYDNKSKQVMQLLRDNITTIPDDWDVEKTTFSNTAQVLREFQK